MKLVELFAGIGSQHQALKNIGVDVEVVAISEIDKFALESYRLLHGEVLNLGDVSKIDPNEVPDCDLLTYSFPCQDISVAGLQAGLDEGTTTRSSLLWECKKIIEVKKPHYLLMENVKNLCGPTHKANFLKWLDWLENQGYKNYWKVLNAVDYNAPQSRERLFCVSILGEGRYTFPLPQERRLVLNDILQAEPIPDNMWMDKPFIPKEKPTRSAFGLIQVGNLDMKGTESLKRVYSPDGVCPTLTTMGGGHRQPKILIDGRVRKLTPKECWAVMGFGDNEFSKVEGKLSNTQLYKQAGNSICVPCLEAIFKNLLV